MLLASPKRYVQDAMTGELVEDEKGHYINWESYDKLYFILHDIRRITGTAHVPAQMTIHKIRERQKLLRLNKDMWKNMERWLEDILEKPQKKNPMVTMDLLLKFVRERIKENNKDE